MLVAAHDWLRNPLDRSCVDPDGLHLAPALFVGGTASGVHHKMVKAMEAVQEFVSVPVRYDVLLNSSHSDEARYATLVHELAHLYCGHIGTPNKKWWPDRRGLSHEKVEFEAESVCYLVCTRLGLDNPSLEYLSGYLDANQGTPEISLDSVLKAAGLIEQMGQARLRPRKTDDQ